ncbi:chitinase [Sinosporangium siamense]|uniref:chitinase n=1 Tax=Sinosporangium siamense TaxID=1367973 RepID=A0A919VAU8_9ACTN|nr:glycoside hydrolase family 18 protein [Sinosporangium siamense]GII91474.1 chitinase [Sinosporangium siamense]
MKIPRIAAALALAVGMTALSATPALAANIAANSGFENGLTGWTCGATAKTVSTPVHAGTAALEATAQGGDFARCSQTVTVQPNTAYTLAARLRGSYVFVGVNGNGVTDRNTWVSSPGAYQQASLAFTTGAATTSVTIYVNTWYGQGTYNADDVTLDGPAGQDQPPPAPARPTVTSDVVDVKLSWNAVAGATGYYVYRGGAKVATVTGTTYTATGLTIGTPYTFEVSAFNAAGESPKSQSVTATPRNNDPRPPGPLPKRVLVGYLHASFANGSGYLRMRDVPSEWDVINLAFGEPTSVTSGDIRFSQCPAAECPNVEPEAEFIAGIREKQAQGKKVLISIGGQNGQVQLTSTAARDKFVQSVSAIIDKYGLDGLDIDFEGHSLYLEPSDTDFRNPTTPVITNLIAAIRTLKARYGQNFVLTMAPETFFVQLGYQFYGPGPNGAADRRAASYLPVIHALRDDLTLLHVQDYNSGPIKGLDDQFHTMGTHDFHVAMTDMLLAGFPIMGNSANVFPPLQQNQVAIGLPAAPWAGNGFTTVAEVQKAFDCLSKGTNCGPYRPRGVYPDLRGLMTWSINWDKYNNFEFSRQHRAYLNALP